MPRAVVSSLSADRLVPKVLRLARSYGHATVSGVAAAGKGADVECAEARAGGPRVGGSEAAAGRTKCALGWSRTGVRALRQTVQQEPAMASDDPGPKRKRQRRRRPRP